MPARAPAAAGPLDLAKRYWRANVDSATFPKQHAEVAIAATPLNRASNKPHHLCTMSADKALGSFIESAPPGEVGPKDPQQAPCNRVPDML
jgi:hypothetical protein